MCNWVSGITDFGYNISLWDTPENPLQLRLTVLEPCDIMLLQVELMDLVKSHKVVQLAQQQLKV
jgi:hypothetical protein